MFPVSASLLLLFTLFTEGTRASPLHQRASCSQIENTPAGTLVATCAQNSIVKTNPWSDPICLAAALSVGVGPFLDQIACLGVPVKSAKDYPLLDYNLYGSIVGSCAWAQGGCPVSSNKFVDFYYNALVKANSKVWPTDGASVINSSWRSVGKWTGKKDTLNVPYLNLKDWLLYSSDKSDGANLTSTSSTAPASSTSTSTPASCTAPVASKPCSNLVSACTSQSSSPAAINIWSKGPCVAAALCVGPEPLLSYLTCAGRKFSSQNAMNLDYGVYSQIVGSCAYTSGGCSITDQNMVDFIYGQLAAIKSSDYPASGPAVLHDIWLPVTIWTKTSGKTTPYNNFADFLRYNTGAPVLPVDPVSATSSSLSPQSSTMPDVSGMSGTSGAVSNIVSSTTPSEIARWLKAHNDERAKHSAPALFWDYDAANAAQFWVNKCNFQHALNGELNSWANPHKAGSFGQNIGVGVSTTGNPFGIEQVMQLYNNEAKLYNYSSPGYTEGTGHWTQVVWKTTTGVGCSQVVCPSVTNFASGGRPSNSSMCLFSPPGNYIGAANFRQNVLSS